MTIIELVLSAVALVVAAALFVNAVEMLGDRLNLGEGAVGSVLAAVGTALPIKWTNWQPPEGPILGHGGGEEPEVELALV